MLLAALKGTDLMYYNVRHGLGFGLGLGLGSGLGLGLGFDLMYYYTTLTPNPGPTPYQVGNGSPYTVLEIVKVVEKVTGKKVPGLGVGVGVG